MELIILPVSKKATMRIFVVERFKGYLIYKPVNLNNPRFLKYVELRIFLSKMETITRQLDLLFSTS
jgi:hypothetical protein